MAHSVSGTNGKCPSVQLVLGLTHEALWIQWPEESSRYTQGTRVMV